jgi:hypothetical protein
LRSIARRSEDGRRHARARLQEVRTDIADEEVGSFQPSVLSFQRFELKRGTKAEAGWN